MKTLILTIAVLMVFPFVAKSETKPFEVSKSELAPVFMAKAELFGIGKPKYNKRKIDRQNSPGPIFRRGKRLQRKNGIGGLLTGFKNVA